MKFSLSIICVVIALAMAGCGGTDEPTDAPTLAKCYTEEFGIAPPAGITHLQARQVVIGDGGGAWLRFVADPATFDGSVVKRFTTCDHSDFTLYDGAGANTPTWWRPVATPTTEFYRCSHWRSGTTNYSEAVLAYDRADHVVYFHHGISF